MRHTFLVVTAKRWLKSVYIYGSYRKIKTGVPLFLDHSVDALLAPILSRMVDEIFCVKHLAMHIPIENALIPIFMF